MTPTPERLRELLAAALDRAQRASRPHHDNGATSIDATVEYVDAFAEVRAQHAALLHQLAEERELRMAVEQSWQHELARAEAAERARDEATGLLQEAFDSIMKAAALAGIDPIPEPEPNSIGGRIAAFLAASGGVNESR